MNFTSFAFPVFFLCVLGGLMSCRSRECNNRLLLVASYVFYASWSVPCVLLILAISVVDYQVGRKLGMTARADSRKRWLAISIGSNLGLLAFFKYTNFLLANAGWGLRLLGWNTSGWRFDIILPVGISFFTFKSLSYTVDVYRGSVDRCQSLRDYLLFVSFFPQLVAGPIVRAADLLPQLARSPHPTVSEIESGLVQCGLGVIKKLAIADQVAAHVDLIFANPTQYDALTLLQGACGYAVQIYCDFSGYSDMAIGTARIMGYRVPENFQMPYSATSITDFWRRWHISLSSWFRDYVFLPLVYALSRRMPAERYVGVRAELIMYVAAIFATFLVCGLWHGAAWTFVVWGGIHGLALAIHRAWKLWRPLRTLAHNRAWRAGSTLLSRLLTLAVVLTGWIVFRAVSLRVAWDYLARVVSWQPGVRMLSPQILAGCVVLAMAHLVIQRDRNWAREAPARPFAVRVVLYACIVFVIATLSASDAPPFIYQQF